jgi:hypothetical protein
MQLAAEGEGEDGSVPRHGSALVYFGVGFSTPSLPLAFFPFYLPLPPFSSLTLLPHYFHHLHEPPTSNKHES